MTERKQFRLPDVGEGLTEADILAWRVKPGDSVTVNQIIVEIETAKAAVELPSPFAGVVAQLLVDEGADRGRGHPDHRRGQPRSPDCPPITESWPTIGPARTRRPAAPRAPAGAGRATASKTATTSRRPRKTPHRWSGWARAAPAVTSPADSPSGRGTGQAPVDSGPTSTAVRA